MRCLPRKFASRNSSKQVESSSVHCLSRPIVWCLVMYLSRAASHLGRLNLEALGWPSIRVGITTTSVAADEQQTKNSNSILPEMMLASPAKWKSPTRKIECKSCESCGFTALWLHVWDQRITPGQSPECMMSVSGFDRTVFRSLRRFVYGLSFLCLSIDIRSCI